ncbi:MAG: Cro/Cl family transcriptional regulator, partial [Gammaproteobacteria bacterium]
PPVEKLAFSTIAKGELTLPEIWSEPLAIIIKALEENSTWLQVAKNLPDTEVKS